MTPAQRKVVKFKPPKMSDQMKFMAAAMADDRRRFEREVANLKRDIDELRRDHDNLAERQQRLQQ